MIQNVTIQSSFARLSCVGYFCATYVYNPAVRGIPVNRLLGWLAEEYVLIIVSFKNSL